MSSRYQPQHDPRYGPRDRSRSPPRFGDRRPSASQFAPSFPNRNPPAGPRGRGAPFYGSDGPDARSGPPSSSFNGPQSGPLGPSGPNSARERSFRDRDFDRRRPLSPPPPPRPRSPARSFRDAPSPRELDIGRARRDSRDGPFSAGPALSDSSSFSTPSFPRGGFGGERGRGRGRGRGDFEFRGGARRPPPAFEDRPSARSREWSPPPQAPPRWGRDESRDSRGDWRTDRPDDDGWSERPQRERDSSWPRRESINPRYENRAESISRAPTPHSQSASTPVLHPERSSIDASRDGAESRRSSSGLYSNVNKDSRQDAPSQNTRASPPPQAPSVPAFGSLSFKAPAAAQSGSNSGSWRPSQEALQPPSPVPAQQSRVPSPLPKTAPTGPRAQQPSAPSTSGNNGSQRPPPEAPKAPRALEPPSAPREAQSTSKPSQPSQPQIPTGPSAKRSEEKLSSAAQARDWNPSFAQNAAKHKLQQPASQQSVPWFNTPSQKPIRDAASDAASARPTQQTDSKSAAISQQTEVHPARAQTPPARLDPPSAPSGPRAARLSTSPQMQNPGIPTAPKADRVPPTGPRSTGSQRPGPPFAPRGPTWNQWRNPNQAPPFRDGAIPAKRDANGDEKDTSRRSFSQTQETAEPRDDQMDVSQRPDELKMGETQSQTSVEKSSQLSESRQDRREIKPDIDEIGDPVDPMLTDESSDDDAMDLGEEDVEATRQKFEQQKARLQSQLVDLSERQYRASTPLEQLARIAKITVQDLPSADELSADGDAPDLEEETSTPQRSNEQDDVDQDLLTPKEEDEVEDVVMNGTEALDATVPPPRIKQSPEVINLPYLLKEPISPKSSFQNGILPRDDYKIDLLAHLQAEAEETEEHDQLATQQFLDAYRMHLELSTQFDDDKAEKERLERQKSADTGPDLDSSSIAPPETPASDSRRLHKFSSEYDIQKVLKESEETARIEQERLDREAQKQRDSLEKEAVPPEMLTEELTGRRAFKNTNNLRSSMQLTDIFGFEPPADDFSQEEHRIFLDAFKERPKKWGEIANLLPSRTYQDCIHHYYAYKWDGRFRERQGKRRKKVGAGRGKGPVRVRGAALMADLGRTEEEVPGATPGAHEPSSTTGRPRRAAASRTAQQDKAQDVKEAASSVPTKKTAKAEAGPDGEKPAKRRRAAAGEKPGRKPRAQQPIAVAGSAAASLLKIEKEIQFRPTEMSKEEMARVDEANLLASLAVPRAAVNPTVPVYHAEPFVQPALQPQQQTIVQPPPPMTESAERPRTSAQQSGAQSRGAASSYWSVPEQNDFVKFLGHFGTDFAAIANHMGTKTQTMVKNYYQRHLDGGDRDDYTKIAEMANTRRDRGEDMGAPPTPTPIVKRRYDNPGLAAPRSLIGPGEIVEEDVAMTGTGLGALPAQSRFPISSLPPSVQQRVAPSPASSGPASERTKSAASGATTQTPQSTGPKMGFFTEQREQRPSLSAQSSSRSVAQGQGRQTGTPSQQRETPALDSSYIQNLVAEQERARDLQREQEFKMSQDRVPTLGQQHHPNVYPNIAPQLGRPSAEMAKRPSDERIQPQSAGLPPSSRAAQSSLRGLLGSPQPTSSAPPMPPAGLPPPFGQARNPSPTKTVGFRPSSVPAGSPGLAPVPIKSTASPAPATTAPSEPRKTSNLASLLNSEPADPMPKKRISDQGVNRPQSPAVPARNVPTPVGPPPFGQPRRESIGQIPGSRAMFDRPPHSTAAPTPPPQRHEPAHWSSLQSARSREDWTPRGSIAQPAPTSSSPNPSQFERDRGLFSHRASALGLGSQARANPSPPPQAAAQAHNYLSHSRNGSYSQMTPPQQPAHPGQHMGRDAPPVSHSVLQPNPYAQPPGPAPHLQQVQQQHPPAGPMHPSYMGMPHSRQRSREEEFLRERERERERQDRIYRDRYEADQRAAAAAAAAHEREARDLRDREAAAYQAEQHSRYGGPPQGRSLHTPSLPPPLHQGPPPPSSYHASSLERGPPSAPLSLREQAEREGMAGYREAQWRIDQERAVEMQQAREREAMIYGNMSRRGDDESEERRRSGGMRRLEEEMRGQPPTGPSAQGGQGLFGPGRSGSGIGGGGYAPPHAPQGPLGRRR